MEVTEILKKFDGMRKKKFKSSVKVRVECEEIGWRFNLEFDLLVPADAAML